MVEDNFALVINDFTEPLTFKMIIKQEECQKAIVDEYNLVIKNGI